VLGKKKRKRKIVDTNAMVFIQTKGGETHRHCLSVYQLVFFPFYGDMMMTHAHT